MTSAASRLFNSFKQNQIVIVLIALVLGFLFPGVFKPIAGYGTGLLMLIFFLSSLRLSLHELRGYISDWRMLIISTAFMLIFLPLAMWLPLRVFAPDWALPFLIIGAMPTGMTIALIAEYFGGKTTLALVITAATSLLAPFTIPIIFQATIGRDVPIPVWQLFRDLLLTIVVPFILANIVQHHAKEVVKKYDAWWREISVIAFGILVAGIVANTTAGSTITLGWDEVGILAVMFIYIGGLLWLAYIMTWWRSAAEKATIALCMIYMNNTLALFIGNRYFSEQHVVPRLVLILIIVNALLPPLRWGAKRAAEGDKIHPQTPQPFSLP